LDECIRDADAVIGAVLVPGASAPRLITRKMLKSMKPGAVLVDVAIDQGGCFETSKATTHAAPTYVVDGIVHYCVANMPGAVALTSSHALNNATLYHGIQLANKGLQAIRDDKHLQNGLNVHRGMITNEAVAISLKKKMVAPLKALETA
jgi:alanine dehydrogenase